MPGPAPAPSPAGWRGWVPPASILVLLVLIVLPEAVLQGADRGWWGSARWRGLAYSHGAFWIGLLGDWRPNFAAQPVVMFLTHAFLHAGLAHLVVNALTLASLGPPLLARLGVAGFWLVCLGAAPGGAAGFALLAETARPMVGASGVLFGLAGAWVALGARDAAAAVTGRTGQGGTGQGGTGQGGRRARLRAAATALAWPVTALVALNLAMIALTPGGIAWQTHLGGALAGAALAPLVARPQSPKPPATPNAV